MIVTLVTILSILDRSLRKRQAFCNLSGDRVVNKQHINDIWQKSALVLYTVYYT